MRFPRLLILLLAAAVLLVPLIGSMVRSPWTTLAQTATTVTVTPDTFAAGSRTTVVVTGTGFTAGETVDLECGFLSDSNGFVDERHTVTAAADGSIEDDSFPVPSDATPGSYVLVASGETSGAFATTNITVTGGSNTPVPTPTNTPVVTNTPTATITGTPATSTPTPTSTSTATATATATVGTPLPPPPGPPSITLPTPTFTPTLTPTPTPTSTPTPTATETPTPLPPIFFSVLAVKVGFGSSTPGTLFKKPSLARTSVDKHVKLVVYAEFSGMVQDTSITVGFRVTRGGTTVYLDKPVETVTPNQNGQRLEWHELFTPLEVGTYRFHGTVFVGAAHKHRTVDFSVSAK